MIEYKDIDGFPGYKISNIGDVYSSYVDRTISYKLNHGYKHVYMNDSFGKRRFVKIHRLVAMHFINIPSYKVVCNHKNGIKTDNRVENLEWVTSSYNNKHAYDTGLKQASKKSVNVGEKHGMAKLNNSDINDILQLLHNGIFQRVIAKKYNVSQATISMIKNNKTWKEVKHVHHED